MDQKQELKELFSELFKTVERTHEICRQIRKEVGPEWDEDLFDLESDVFDGKFNNADELMQEWEKIQEEQREV